MTISTPQSQVSNLVVAIVTLIATLVVTALFNRYFQPFLQHRPAMTGDVLIVPFTAPSVFNAPNLSCMLTVTVQNNSGKPIRQVRVSADNAVLYTGKSVV